MSETTVIYNGQCRICSREIGIYRARAEAEAVPVGFVDLTAGDLAAFGLTEDQAARRLHVVERGQLYAGVDGFLVLWRATPGFAWLARLVALPGIRQLAGFAYDWVLAPMLYRQHLRRQRRV